MSVKIALYTSYIRSALIYYFVGPLATGLVDKSDIDKFEITLRRQILKVPNDVANDFIANTTSWYTRSASDIIEDLAARVEVANATNGIPEKIVTERPPAQQLKIDKPVLNLMYAVSRSRTTI